METCRETLGTSKHSLWVSSSCMCIPLNNLEYRQHDQQGGVPENYQAVPAASKP